MEYYWEIPESLEERKKMKLCYPHFVAARLDELSFRMLEKMCDRLGVSRSEAIRRSIVFTYCMYILKKKPEEVLQKIIEEGEIV